MHARLPPALCAVILAVVGQSTSAEVAPEKACNDFRAALHAYENGNVEHDTLLDPSEAVNRAITNEAAAAALDQIWNLRRARSFATMALGMWAYPIGSDVPETIKEEVARLHRRGQQLTEALQTLYYDAVELACIQASIQAHQ